MNHIVWQTKSRGNLTNCGLELQDIRVAILSALRVSYISNEEKTIMITAFQAEFDRLGLEL